ncbi:hypothetical protein [Mucilaginibacter sp.]|uniref:hypothetical protein n=1 Tax=Mucilaginibacter sp. TaxID=1882438 RepID=UPI003264C840
MSLFEKRNREVVASGTATLIGKVGGSLNTQQMRFAGYLNDKTVQLSNKSKIIFLVLVCMLFGGASLYFLINAFN